MAARRRTPRSFAVHTINLLPSGLARRLRGSSRIASLLRPVVNQLVPAGPTVVTIRSGRGAGMRIEIDPRSEKYYWTGTYEPEVTAELARILAPGAVFWDVGAHVGYMTIIAARLVGSSGRVVAFEPLSANLDRLRHAVTLNALDNVIVRPVAIAGRPGQVPFHVHSRSSMGSLRRRVGEIEVTHVEASTLDHEAQSQVLPSLVKIDVEGGEVDVLEGAQRLFSEFCPAVMIECLSADALHQCQDRLSNYQFRALDRTNYLGVVSRGSVSPRAKP